MSKKEQFIYEVELLINIAGKPLSEDAATYFEALKGVAEKEVKTFTENGKLIIKYMQDNKDDYSNLFKARDIGEGLGISSKTASGAMRKLVTDGYVEKMGENPTQYSLTSKGAEINVDEA